MFKFNAFHFVTSFAIEHVGLLLGLAAATSNVTMRDACIATLAVDIDRVFFISAIWEHMPEEQLIDLLTKSEVATLDGERKLRVVCSWIDGGVAKNQLRERRDRFRQLLKFVDLATITEKSLMDIISFNYALTESRQHR